MEKEIVQKPNKFMVGQIAFCNGGWHYAAAYFL